MKIDDSRAILIYFYFVLVMYITALILSYITFSLTLTNYYKDYLATNVRVKFLIIQGFSSSAMGILGILLMMEIIYTIVILIKNNFIDANNYIRHQLKLISNDISENKVSKLIYSMNIQEILICFGSIIFLMIMMFSNAIMVRDTYNTLNNLTAHDPSFIRNLSIIALILNILFTLMVIIRLVYLKKSSEEYETLKRIEK